MTINITDQYAADLRFTLGDITIKGKINTIGSNNKLNAIQTSTVTVTGENAALNIDSYLLVGYHTYKGSNDTVNTYKSTLSVEDGASVSIDGTVYVNLESTISVTDAIFAAGSLVNYGNVILDDAVMTLGGLTSTGSIAMDIDSTISFTSISGTITIDVTNIEQSFGNKLLDYTGSDTSSWTIDSYKAVISNWSSEMDSYLVVVDGDLCVRTKKVVYVNGSYTDASQNQFKTHDEAVAAGADTIITVSGTVSSAIEHEGVAAVIEGGTYNGTVSGGAITASDNKNWDDRTGDTDMTITAGTFNKMVIGADRVNTGNSERIGDVNTTLTGGTFNSIVVGGMLYVANSNKGQALLSGDVNLTIAGGTFKNIIYGGNITATDTYSSRAVMEGNINITIDATNEIVFASGSKICAGSYRFGSVDGDVTVTITGLASNITMHNNFEIWGGCGGDGYLAGSDRVFQTNISGDRTISFADCQGSFKALIRGFETLEIVDGSQVSLDKSNLSDIKHWVFEAGSTLTGALNNDFAKDTLEIDVTDWNDSSCDLVVGDSLIFNGVTSLASVTVGSETLTFDGVSKWASASYELEYKDGEDGKKVLAFSKLA